MCWFEKPVGLVPIQIYMECSYIVHTCICIVVWGPLRVENKVPIQIVCGKCPSMDPGRFSSSKTARVDRGHWAVEQAAARARSRPRTGPRSRPRSRPRPGPMQNFPDRAFEFGSNPTRQKNCYELRRGVRTHRKLGRPKIDVSMGLNTRTSIKVYIMMITF